MIITIDKKLSNFLRLPEYKIETILLFRKETSILCMQ